MFPNKQPTACGVHIQTWGTEYGGGTGIASYIKTILYGGNPGHASLTLTIPDNEKTLDLITKYCVSNDETMIIPFNKKTVKLANGKSENVYEIYFSMWPIDDKDWLVPVILIKTIVWPFNKIASVLSDPKPFNIVNAPLDQTLTEIQANDESKEIGKFLNNKIIEVNNIDPIQAILDFATILTQSDVIAVFSKKDISRLINRVNENNVTPIELESAIKNLKLYLPEKLDYTNLNDLVDALQLLSWQRAKSLADGPIKNIRERRARITTQHDSALEKLLEQNSNQLNAHNSTKDDKPAQKL